MMRLSCHASHFGCNYKLGWVAVGVSTSGMKISVIESSAIVKDCDARRTFRKSNIEQK